MHLVAALVPPPDVLDHVRSALASVEVPAPVAPVPSDAPSRSSRRLGWRRVEPQAPIEPPPPPPPMLTMVPVHAMHVTIARFGHLTTADVSRLIAALESEAREWAAPRLHCSGGVALEPMGDDSVWVRLAGELDELRSVTRGIVRAAQRLQLFVDRREFRPLVQLGTITDHTTEAYLEQVLAALDALESPAWSQTTIPLMTPSELQPGTPPFRCVREITLGPTLSG